ncbi:MAG: hypothetical protein JWR17_1486 [Pseudomonas sp.]|jgi:hypothetical protein|uniref:hypothetical protein n=1 Tax=Pseudomonas sp. TaxID=306 RepID=UPI00260EC468|nr:hypothetical protein [Pseudomonas sp.]MDB6048740.1 hypothetical protein [Pseudomonas sp.]
MNTLTTWRVYAALIGLLVLELLCATSSLGLKNWLVAAAAFAQFSLLLLAYLGIGRTHGWVQLFGCLYLLWLVVMFGFVLGEVATR